jgi:hypothetical protein
VKADCYLKGGGKEGQWPNPNSTIKGKASAAVAQTADSDNNNNDNDIYVFAVATNFSVVAHANTLGSKFTRLLDSGASKHFEPRCKNFTMYREIPPSPITSANGHTFQAIGKGKVVICVKTSQGHAKLQLQKVLHAPSMLTALISVSAMARAQFNIHFKLDQAAHLHAPNGTILLQVPERAGLFLLRDDRQTVLGWLADLLGWQICPKFFLIFHYFSYIFTLLFKCTGHFSFLFGLLLL